MASHLPDSPLANRSVGYGKIKFIGMFVGSALIGVALFLVAVFNASNELAIVNEVRTMHDMMQDRVVKLAGAQQTFSQEATERLAVNLSTEEYRVLPVYAGQSQSGVIAWGAQDRRIPWERIEESRISEQGGYLEEGTSVYTWSQLQLPGAHRLLVLHRHKPLEAHALAGVYQNRLIVPAVFYIWMTVWVSLMLNGLVKRLRAQKESVERMAWHDPLTGLANRNLFFKTLDALVERSHTENRSFLLAVVDLDGFKQVNDTLGHDVGDLLLMQVADRFRQTVRKDDVVARTGGDEFILLFPDSDFDGCQAVCERIVEELRAEYLVLGHHVRISASLGVARFPQDANEIVELTREADKSMYRAKRSGGGMVCYSGRANDATSCGIVSKVDETSNSEER